MVFGGIGWGVAGLGGVQRDWVVCSGTGWWVEGLGGVWWDWVVCSGTGWWVEECGGIRWCTAALGGVWVVQEWVAGVSVGLQSGDVFVDWEWRLVLGGGGWELSGVRALR